MSVTVSTTRSRKPKNFPLYRTLPGFARDPLKELERISRAANGEIVRLDLGIVRPLLVTRPEHLQIVLRERSDDYARDGIFWRPLDDLMGIGVLGGTSESWATSRRVLQPVFTARNVRALTGRLADTINEAVDELDAAAQAGRPVQASREMARIVNQTVVRIFFGGKIGPAEIGKLDPAFEAVIASLAFRVLLPFMPETLMPRGRSYRAGIRAIDEVMYGLVERYRDDPGEDLDIFTALCRARSAEGSGLTDKWVRDNLVGMYAAGTETTATALSWLWPLLCHHPDVAERLYEEIDRVVGGDRVRPEHLEGLTYTKQVVQELLRLYPVGWQFPRVAVRSGNIDGFPVKKGQTLLISPYLTHHLESVWDRPHEFDPDRFAPERASGRHRYAYFPFGGGPHQCVGNHLFHIEAQLIAASVLSRYRPEPVGPVPSRPGMGRTLRLEHELEMRLVPVGERK
ncbi:cytochrome P450 [Actinomadura hallensis]|uniref:Cytochrome P450 n=1 Tax=Actinomadura hallensis TaxID=337895 RepID=A0A543IMC5_9ACTN|nr:cytochrome P450 [Actinomadura hallensis]TQM71737.1 cytochrome P450 [Actinomadura hallensis]